MISSLVLTCQLFSGNFGIVYKAKWRGADVVVSQLYALFENTYLPAQLMGIRHRWKKDFERRVGTISWRKLRTCCKCDSTRFETLVSWIWLKRSPATWNNIPTVFECLECVPMENIRLALSLNMLKEAASKIYFWEDQTKRLMRIWFDLWQTTLLVECIIFIGKISCIAI